MTTLFLAWQAPQARAWFPIGRLDASIENKEFVFQYTHGALQAQEHAGFSPLLAFPEFERRYESSELFPLFKNRVLDPNRKDFAEYLNWMGLDPAHTDPIEILSQTGGQRQTDSLEVFPQVQKMADGTISCRFFLHGLRHVPKAAQERVKALTEGESLQVAIEVNNPAGEAPQVATKTNNPTAGYAVQLQTKDYHMIGWGPRYLVNDLRTALLKDATLTATVRRINPAEAPLARRVLIDLQGGVLPTDFEPMASQEYRVLSS